MEVDAATVANGKKGQDDEEEEVRRRRVKDEKEKKDTEVDKDGPRPKASYNFVEFKACGWMSEHGRDLVDWLCARPRMVFDAKRGRFHLPEEGEAKVGEQRTKQTFQ